MNYRKLDVYKMAVRFLPMASGFAAGLPKGYGGFAQQLRDASLSIVTNIGEGSGKTGRADQRRFYAISRGSAMEWGAIVDACMVLQFISERDANEANEILESIVRMLSKMCLPPGRSR